MNKCHPELVEGRRGNGVHSRGNKSHVYFHHLKFQLARNFLSRLHSKTHTKNWRPQILVVCTASRSGRRGPPASADHTVLQETETGCPPSDHHSDEEASCSTRAPSSGSSSPLPPSSPVPPNSTTGRVDNDDAVRLDDESLITFVSQLKGGRGVTYIGGICEANNAEFFDDGLFFSSGVSGGGIATEETAAGTAGRSSASKTSVLPGSAGDFAKTTGAGVLPAATGGGLPTADLLAKSDQLLQDLMAVNKIKGFGRLLYTQNFCEGMLSLVQTCGIGAFSPNCVLAKWPENAVGGEEHLRGEKNGRSVGTGEFKSQHRAFIYTTAPMPFTSTEIFVGENHVFASRTFCTCGRMGDKQWHDLGKILSPPWSSSG